MIAHRSARAGGAVAALAGWRTPPPPLRSRRRCDTSGVERCASCPACDLSVAVAEVRCPRCGFALMEQRVAGRDVVARLARFARSRRAVAMGLVAAMALVTAVGVVPAVQALSAALAPASTPLPSAQVESRLADRYPRLRQADHAVIACPGRPVEPGGQTRCWVLARVGHQRAVTVRLSPRGNEVEIDD
jgi:hypothetical protein